MVIAQCIAYDLSVFHQLITPRAILCIIPPLSSDFVIITDMGSSYEIGRQGFILGFFFVFFSPNSMDSQHMLHCIQNTALKICSISHGLLQHISLMLP